ncbi:MAG TPA: ABC transporter ATP-binding protein [Kofleriaceae bacterium]|jgi:branched-chain amino acid transport system ATP-binding protein|nr:ABC transporter ATP-binding protein [Kofleriaceae bacterium]
MALLEVTDVTRRFGGITAVDRCSFAIREGSLTGLIGPNGAGKTTMFNLIAGALRPDSGEIRLEGRRLDRLRPHRIARLGLSRTFQLTRELADLTVLENVVVHAPVRVIDLLRPSIGDAERARAMELLTLVGLAAMADAPAGGLSYGQKKLLELAAALMPAPRLLLLDEPAAGVNPALLDAIVGYIERVHRSGVTFLIVEHNMDLVMSLCDPIIVMAHGTVLAQGPRDAIQRDRRVLDAYLGAA